MSIQAKGFQTRYNKNVYAYLKNFSWNKAWLSLFPSYIQKQYINFIKHYDAQYNYAEFLYCLFIEVERNLKQLKKNPEFVTFVHSVYENHNNILEETYGLIQDLVDQHGGSGVLLKKNIFKSFKYSGIAVKKHSPVFRGSFWGRIHDFFAKEYKPQYTTNLPSVRKIEYAVLPYKELRMGMQIQEHEGKTRIHPLFHIWLDDLQSKSQKHLYFNYLHGHGLSFNQQKEKRYGRYLHELEKDHPNFYIITLPASGGWLAASYSQQHEKNVRADDCQQQFLKAFQCEHLGDSDFYISPALRKILQLEKESAQWNTIIADSFQAFGIKPTDIKMSSISKKQMQAIWYYCVKYQLPAYCIAQSHPDFVNHTCKDGIDRGGASSIFYHLIASFKTENPLGKAYFEQALHAAPSQVKARGMNNQIDLLWSVLEEYVIANYVEISQNPKKAWLIEWLDLNCPASQAPHYLQNRLSNISKNNPQLTFIVTWMQQYQKARHLAPELLEITARSAQWESPSFNIKKYHQLMKQISATHRIRDIFQGVFFCIVGLCIRMGSVGEKDTLWRHGVSLLCHNPSASARKELVTHMKKLESEVLKSKTASIVL